MHVYITGGGRLAGQHKFYSYRVRALYFLTNMHVFKLVAIALCGLAIVLH